MSGAGGRRWGVSVLALSLLLIVGAGIAAAAVSGNFSATYDGYEDGSSTDAVGHEIVVEGTIEVTGDSAVNPRIVIKGAKHTVLDTSTVKVFVEGDRSIQFERTYGPGKVELRTNEIPAGTTIRVRYLTYLVGGADARQVTAGQVNVFYKTPSGTQERTSFAPTADISSSPEQVIQNLKQGDTLTQIQEIVSYVGGFAIVLLLVLLGMRIKGGGGGGGGIE